jgi:hypothetical protein
MNPVRWILTRVVLGLVIAVVADAKEIGHHL